MRTQDFILLEQAYQTVLEAKQTPCPCTVGKKCKKDECPCSKCKKAKAKEEKMMKEMDEMPFEGEAEHHQEPDYEEVENKELIELKTILKDLEDKWPESRELRKASSLVGILMSNNREEEELE